MRAMTMLIKELWKFPFVCLLFSICPIVIIYPPDHSMSSMFVYAWCRVTLVGGQYIIGKAGCMKSGINLPLTGKLPAHFSSL